MHTSKLHIEIERCIAHERVVSAEDGYTVTERSEGAKIITSSTCAGAARRDGGGQSHGLALPIEWPLGMGLDSARRGASTGGTQATGSAHAGTASAAAASAESGGPAGAGMACASSAAHAATAEEEERHENVVEKRLKQNREAARRSRERKRHLKEELRRRLPILQEQHDAMAAEVDNLMKCIQVR